MISLNWPVTSQIDTAANWADILRESPREEMKKLIGRAWPGNVRELEHCIEQSVILSDNGSLVFSDPVLPHGEGAQAQTFSEIMSLKDLERAYIEKILDMTHRKVTGRGSIRTRDEANNALLTHEKTGHRKIRAVPASRNKLINRKLKPSCRPPSFTAKNV